MSRQVEAFCEEFAEEGIPLGGIEHSLLRDERRNPKPNPGFPKAQLLRAIRYKVDYADLALRKHQKRLLRGAFYAFVYNGEYIEDRKWVRIVTKAMNRGDQQALNWPSITQLDQPNALDIPLSVLGKNILPRGKKIMRSHDPFMEVFFTDDAYLLRQIACAVTAGDPDRMRVFFAKRPISFSRRPDIYPVTQMAELTPGESNLAGFSPFDRLSLKNEDVGRIYSEMKRRLAYGNDPRVYDPSFEFAQVYTGGNRLVSFDFVPKDSSNQLETIKGHKKVKRIEVYVTPWGRVSQYETVEDVIFEQPEEEVGIYFPRGDIRVRWFGKRRVVNRERDGLMKELMGKYHTGNLSRLNGSRRNGKLT